MFIRTDMNTTAHQRLERLTVLLQQQGEVQVSVVAGEWGISEMTVRRDLQRLAEQGVAARVHGGAVAAGGLRFASRLDRHGKEKRRAVSKLIESLPDAGCIYLDGSTTIYHLIDALARRPGLQVATNNSDTFHRLAQVAGIRPLLIGGELNTATDNLVGPLSHRAVEGLSFIAAYTSAYALDPEAGGCEPEAADAEIKSLVARRSRRVYVAINHHKLGRYAAASWQWRPETTVLATDLDPADPRLNPYRSLIAEII
ncbi:MAG: DeoR/GlpR transcriptional regulator [Planctomycetota bacterium]|nr:MAG: DeoR/GlpR transcriptional regulator [Planctomycetota bacterium]